MNRLFREARSKVVLADYDISGSVFGKLKRLIERLWDAPLR